MLIQAESAALRDFVSRVPLDCQFDNIFAKPFVLRIALGAEIDREFEELLQTLYANARSLIACASLIVFWFRQGGGDQHSSPEPIGCSSDLWRLLRVMQPVALAPQCEPASVDNANCAQTSWELGPADLNEGCTHAPLASQPFQRGNCAESSASAALCFSA